MDARIAALLRKRKAMLAAGVGADLGKVHEFEDELRRLGYDFAIELEKLIPVARRVPEHAEAIPTAPKIVAAEELEPPVVPVKRSPGRPPKKQPEK